MYKEFALKDEDSPPDPDPVLTPEQRKRMDILLERYLPLEQRPDLEHLLLKRLKENKRELEAMLGEMSSHSNYEDHFYRYYHGSWKVYRTQRSTERAVALLRKLLPERELNLMFEAIRKEGAGKDFKGNDNWDSDTRPLLEAFCHAKYMVEMAVRYADSPQPPQPMPSGYAALLYLYDIR
jgi:hypothetical protein